MIIDTGTFFPNQNRIFTDHLLIFQFVHDRIYRIWGNGEAYLKELQHDYENMISGMSAIFDSLEKGDTHE